MLKVDTLQLHPGSRQEAEATLAILTEGIWYKDLLIRFRRTEKAKGNSEVLEGSNFSFKPWVEGTKGRSYNCSKLEAEWKGPLELKVRPLRRDTARLALEILRGVVYLVFQVWEKWTANRIQLLLTEHRHLLGWRNEAGVPLTGTGNP